MNSVEYTHKAAKQLRKIPANESRTIREECDALAAMPNCRNIKALVNHEYDYRLRVGRYRVFFNFDGLFVSFLLRR